MSSFHPCAWSRQSTRWNGHSRKGPSYCHNAVFESFGFARLLIVWVLDTLRHAKADLVKGSLYTVSQTKKKPKSTRVSIKRATSSPRPRYLERTVATGHVQAKSWPLHNVRHQTSCPWPGKPDTLPDKWLPPTFPDPPSPGHSTAG